MNEMKKIKTALISVFHKDGLDELLQTLHAEGVQLLSTGGTHAFIESLGLPCSKVEDLTTYPSILGGRVKTLHPKVFGGILGRRALESDQAEMAKYEIPEIDLVVVDLYPFEQPRGRGRRRPVRAPPPPPGAPRCGTTPGRSPPRTPPRFPPTRGRASPDAAAAAPPTPAPPAKGPRTVRGTAPPPGAPSWENARRTSPWPPPPPA